MNLSCKEITSLSLYATEYLFGLSSRRWDLKPSKISSPKLSLRRSTSVSRLFSVQTLFLCYFFLLDLRFLVIFGNFWL